MTSLEFRDRWADRLETYPLSALQGIAIPEDPRSFLLHVGLPNTVSTVCQLDDPAYNRYRVIGFNGSGDPICLDEREAGEVVYLNHDDHCRRIFINKTVLQLAESLLTFRQFIRETQIRGGADAYLDGDIPADLREWVEYELRRVDQHAFQPDSFWPDALANVDALKA